MPQFTPLQIIAVFAVIVTSFLLFASDTTIAALTGQTEQFDTVKCNIDIINNPFFDPKISSVDCNSRQASSGECLFLHNVAPLGIFSESVTVYAQIDGKRVSKQITASELSHTLTSLESKCIPRIQPHKIKIDLVSAKSLAGTKSFFILETLDTHEVQV